MSRCFTEVRVVVRFIRMCGRLTSTWPPDPGASVLKNSLRELLWLASFLNVLALLVPLMLAVSHFRHELGAVMKSLSELTALSEVFFNLILCKIQRRRLQVIRCQLCELNGTPAVIMDYKGLELMCPQTLLSEITNYVENAEKSERLVLQKYVDRYIPFLMSVGSSYLMTAVVFSCGPILMTTTLPADAWYPFSIEPLFTKCALYVLQVLAILQTGLCITVDFMVGMMLWYTAARFEMLCTKISNAANEAQLNTCIEEHQKLIVFGKEISNAVRLIILKGNATMAMVVICGGFPLIHHEPLLVLSQFVLMVVGGLLRLYVSAWPADDLTAMSEHVGLSTYRSHWIDGSPQMRKSVMFVIQRSRKPVVISVGGILPALTLKFYASFVSSTLSYFMTMRAIFGE